MERFGKRNKEKTISLELSGLKHNANCGKTFAIHTKDTFWWCQLLSRFEIFQMGFKVSHLQIGDSLTEETKIFHTWTDWIENHKNDLKTMAVNLRKTSRTELAGGVFSFKKDNIFPSSKSA